jgi:hypothetical protein
MHDITALALHITALMVLFAACVVLVAVGLPL